VTWTRPRTESGSPTSTTDGSTPTVDPTTPPDPGRAPARISIARGSGTGLLLLAFALAGCSGGGADLSSGEALIPPDALATLTLTNLEASLETFGIDTLRTRHPEAIERFGRSWRRQIGFDPTDADAARRVGVDPARPMTVAFLEEPAGATLALIPGDPDSLLAGVRAMIERQGGTLREAGTHAGVPLHDGDRTGTTCLPLVDQLAVVTGVALADERLALCRRLLDGEGSLSASDGYRALTSRLAPDADARVFARTSTRPMPLADPTSSAGLNALERARSVLFGAGDDAATAMSLDLRQDGLRLDSAGYLASSPWASLRPASLRGQGGITRYLGGTPIGLLQVAVRGDSLVVALQRTLDAMAAAADTSGATTRSRLRLADSRAGDVLALAEGRVGAVVYGFGFTGVDLVLYAEVADPGGVRPLLAELAARIAANPPTLPMLGQVQPPVEDTIEGVSFHRLPVPPFAEVCWGVVHDAVLVTVTRERMGAAIRGAESFVPTLPENDLKSAVHDGAAMVSYVDVSALGGIVSMLPVRTPETREVAALLQNFDHASAIATIDGDFMTGSLTLKGDDPHLWPMLFDAVLGALTDRAALAPGVEG